MTQFSEKLQSFAIENAKLVRERAQTWGITSNKSLIFQEKIQNLSDFPRLLLN
jgi:hypothetical protein